MSQATTASRPSIAQGMFEEFERELATTRRYLQRLPGDKLAWRPHPKSMSAGQLGYHIAETPGLALQMCIPDRGSPPDMSQREEPATLSELLARLDASESYVRQTLPGLSDARMLAPFTIDVPGGDSLQLPRAGFLRSIMLNHWYHHRGQLGVYLRLLGVPVPFSYGPSGDEPGGL